MPKVITRYFHDTDELESVRKELIFEKRLPRHIVQRYGDADSLVASLTSKGVAEATAEAYQKRLSAGGAVLLVEADATPLGVARITRETFAASGAADLGDLAEEAVVKSARPPRGGGRGIRSVLPHGPLMLTRWRDRTSTNYYMANWPIPLLSKKLKGVEPVIPRHGRMASWPIGLLVPGQKFMANFPFGHIVPGHKFMANFPFGHIVPGHKFQAKFPFGHIVPGHKFQANFPFGHIVPGHKFMANFPFGHLVPGHTRMARWPFPLLINDTTHSNSLVPGHKYMARFPFDHLVPGHKFQAKFPFGHIVPGHKFMAKFPFAHIVPGHKFMAKFPFAHIVPGHKYMAKFPFDHIVPGHKYMANWIWPHTKTEAAA